MSHDRYERRHRATNLLTITTNLKRTKMVMPSARQAVLNAIALERGRQVEKWGDSFDDANTDQDWAAFIMHYTAIGTTSRLGAAAGIPFRDAMVKVAALAAAAVEAHDRKHPPF